jgi:hypothetical protein
MGNQRCEKCGGEVAYYKREGGTMRHACAPHAGVDWKKIDSITYGPELAGAAAHRAMKGKAPE